METLLEDRKCVEFSEEDGGNCSGPFAQCDTIGTYLIGAGLIKLVYTVKEASNWIPNPNSSSCTGTSLHAEVGIFGAELGSLLSSASLLRGNRR
mmetsp:Transcript_40669/g.73262  ORF Transcript_40669/g.73262 Transcript_40669/m.73262 type:complete len:94 (-) Transcript_40669:214-495(-)